MAKWRCSNGCNKVFETATDEEPAVCEHCGDRVNVTDAEGRVLGEDFVAKRVPDDTAVPNG